jgi:hypothetical protein
MKQRDYIIIFISAYTLGLSDMIISESFPFLAKKKNLITAAEITFPKCMLSSLPFFPFFFFFFF